MAVANVMHPDALYPRWKRKYEKLQEQTKDFMAALKRAPRKVKEFIQFMLHTEPEKPEQSRSRDMPRRKKRDMEL